MFHVERREVVDRQEQFSTILKITLLLRLKQAVKYDQ